MKWHFPFSKSSGPRRSYANYSVYQPEYGVIAGDSASVLEASVVASTIGPDLPSPNLEVKKVDHFFSKWSNKWKYRDSSSKVIPELRPLPVESGKDDVWRQYCFVVIRELPHTEASTDANSEGWGLPKRTTPYFLVMIKSPYLRKACRDVLGDIRGIPWDTNPLELDPHLLLTYLPYFQTYRDDIKVEETHSEENYVRLTLDVLIDYLRKDYQATLASIKSLTSRGEITFELLFAVLLSRSIMVTTSRATGELEALRLVSATKSGSYCYNLICECIGVVDPEQGSAVRPAWHERRMAIYYFDGVVKINSLDIYPIQYHPHEDEIRRTLIARGRKWASLCGEKVHHLQYRGTALLNSEYENLKLNVNSRVMVDRVNFGRRGLGVIAAPRRRRSCRRYIPEDTYCHNDASSYVSVQERREYDWRFDDLTDDEYLIAPHMIFGYSLSDRMWMEFNVNHLSPIEWNETAFSNLVLPPDRKMLLQSLIEGHNADLGFDDFITGKGQGLVVNFFGPPGVGKTLSAEATSEHVKRPLYIVGASDLGTTASELDRKLQQVFELAAAWKAIVLIDEADVFLEERSLHDLERNAMVAVFLRHLEYYPSILFLTTNRVKTFDPAFLSRIHIALHFQEFSTKAREQVWTAFLDKVGVKIGAVGGVSEEELKKLGERDINGRQVKNATKTAQCLAVSRGEKLQYKHLLEVLDVVEQFSTDFGKMRNEAA